MRTAIILAVFVFIPAIAFSSTIIVPDDQPTIQAAIDAAVDGDTVLVKPGTYVENIDFKGKAVTVMSEQGAEVTIIDGNQAGSVVTFKTSETSTSILDGFTVTNGTGTDGLWYGTTGGGIVCDGSSPTLRNNIITANKAYLGGGMYNYYSSPTVTNCTFSKNKADFGGGMYNWDNSSPTVTNCTFSKNSVGDYGYGGGMCNWDNSSPTVTNCTFTGNKAKASGGGMCNWDNSSPTVTNCTFTGNSAEKNGGGMFNAGDITVTNCTFSENEATYGGGMFNAGDITVTNCTFTGNKADHGGGMRNEGSSPTVTNCTFTGNSANMSGGGMSNKGRYPIVTNCVFSENKASSGGGMYNHESNPIVTNCIFWNDTPDEIYNQYSNSPTVTYCCVQGGYFGTGNIFTDPLFFAPGNGDFHLTVSSPCIDAGDNNASQLPSTDFEGDPRILDGDGDTIAVVDMGCDEFVFPPNYIYVPDDYPTIQAAINISNNGCTIIVRSGTYMENIDFKGKAITVKSEQGVAVTVIDGNQAWSVVICQSGEGSDTVLDGFTVLNGTGTTIVGDQYGGGMFNYKSSPTVTNCTFTGNSAFHGYGGGMCNTGSSPTVTNCTFSENSADYGDGGGMHNDNSNPTVTNCTFTGNKATLGGGMGNEGSSPTVTNCTFSENEVTYGGGMNNYYSSPTVTNCTFTRNSANFFAGGMNNNSSNPTVTNCTFSKNSADHGGGMGNFFSNPTVTNCTFTGNKAGGGGGMGNEGSSPTVTNTVLWNNEAPEGPEIWLGKGFMGVPSTLTISYSDVQGGQTSVHVDPGCTLNWGPGMIDSDPLFADLTNGDFHLTFNSPCRASGDNSAVTELTDFEGDPRICYGTVDMGADECFRHLYCTGDVTPGGSVELKFIDLPGAYPVGFWIAFNALDTPIPGAYGDWWLLPPMIGPFSLPPIPANGVYVLPGTIPATPPGPYTLYLQAIMGTPLKLSNLCTMDVE